MAFNASQFKQKKKRAVNPDAPPRPNLMIHDKKLREQTDALGRLIGMVRQQQAQIERLQTKYESMQNSIDQVITFLRKR
jgi:hypothetical protein